MGKRQGFVEARAGRLDGENDVICSKGFPGLRIRAGIPLGGIERRVLILRRRARL